MTTALNNLIAAATPNAVRAGGAPHAAATPNAKGATPGGGVTDPATNRPGAPSEGAADKSAVSERPVRPSDDKVGAKPRGSGAMQAPTTGANLQGATPVAESFAAVLAGAATKGDAHGAKGQIPSEAPAGPVGTEQTTTVQTVASASVTGGPKASAQLTPAAGGQIDRASGPAANAAVKGETGSGPAELKLAASPAGSSQQTAGGQARTATTTAEAPATAGTVQTPQKVPPEAATPSAKAGHVIGHDTVIPVVRRAGEAQTVAKGSAPDVAGRPAIPEQTTRAGAVTASDSASDASPTRRTVRGVAANGQEHPTATVEQSDGVARAQRAASPRAADAQEPFAAVVRRAPNGESSSSSPRSAAQGGTDRPAIAIGAQATQPRVVRGMRPAESTRASAAPDASPATAKAGEAAPHGRVQLHVGDASVSVANAPAAGQTTATVSAFTPAAAQGVSATSGVTQTTPGAPAAYATVAGTTSDVAPAGRVAEAIRLSAVRGERRMTIRLDPPELGQVRVTLHARGRDVTATVQADSARTLGELQREAAAMVDRLGESGVEIRRIDFSLTDTPTGQHGADTGANSAFGGREGAWQQADARGGDGGRSGEHEADGPGAGEPTPDDETKTLAGDGATINVRM